MITDNQMQKTHLEIILGEFKREGFGSMSRKKNLNLLFSEWLHCWHETNLAKTI